MPDPTNPWFYATVVLYSAIVWNLVPIIRAFLKKIELDAAGKWFDDADYYEEQQSRLKDSFGRMRGTLVFWKNQAAAYRLLNLSRIIWSLISGGLVPVLLQAFDRSDTYATVFMVSFTTWTGFIVVVAFSRKAEERYQGFRMVESSYYDLCRNILDFPASDVIGRKRQVDLFLRQVEQIRDVGRKVVETGSPPEFDFVKPLRQLTTPAEQGGTGQPATRSESKPEDGDKPQPEAERRSR